jgi:ribonuclease P protein component
MRFAPGKFDEYRVAVVVSKKVAKVAPDRNRIRRRVYEAIRLLAPGRLTNEDIVITIFDDRFLTLPHDELHESIKRQLDYVASNSKQPQN